MSAPPRFSIRGIPCRGLFVALIALSLFGGGCGTFYHTRATKLRDTSRRFNSDVRWQRFQAASQALAPARREAWVERMTRAAHVFTIADYELHPVKVAGNTAIIEVDLTYYPVGGVILRAARFRQVWKYGEGTWRLTRETRLHKAIKQIALPPVESPMADPGAR